MNSSKYAYAAAMKRRICQLAIDCAKTADHQVHFHDGDIANACDECAINIVEVARHYGTNVKVERLENQQ